MVVYGEGLIQQHALYDELPRIKSGELPAGDQAVGWMAYVLPRSVTSSLFGGSVPFPEQWQLSIPLGRETQELDLRRMELDHGPRLRFSTLDSSIPVIEIGGRLNGLNVDKLTTPLESFLKEKRSVVILFTESDVFIDSIANSRIANIRPREGWRNVPVYWAGVSSQIFSKVHSQLIGGGTYRGVESESAAVMYILGERASPETALMGQLRSTSAEVRALAATALRNHADRPGVFKSLVSAISDDDPRVERRQLARLDDYFSGMPGQRLALVRPSAPPAQRKLEGDLLETMLVSASDADITVRVAAIGILRHCQDPRAAKAILAALKDSERSVRMTAARSAATQPADIVAEPLLELLDDEQVAWIACDSVGQLKPARVGDSLSFRSCGTTRTR